MPPCDEQASSKDSPDLSGAKVICSIRASEPRKPSYYHSFGETHSVCTESLIKIEVVFPALSLRSGSLEDKVTILTSFYYLIWILFLFSFPLPIRAPLTFCSPSIISAYKCGLDLHIELVLPPLLLAETRSSLIYDRENKGVFWFSLNYSFLQDQIIVQKWQLSPESSPVSLCGWSLPKLSH